MGKLSMTFKKFETWFDRQKRVLPWRDAPTPYRVWISEVMLQQTQVITVVPFFERFIQRFPDVETLAHAPLEEVLLLWSGLGYYSRARNLHAGAQKIISLGRFPQTRAEWLAIPGVGSYTAGAILSIAENQVESILDGNVERVLSRVRRVSRKHGDAQYKARLWKLSTLFVEFADRHKIQPRVLNQALMELGAMVCTPKKPNCLLCPLREICRASQTGEQELYPPKKKPKQWIHLEEKTVALVDSQKQIYMERRSSGQWRAGLWDVLEAPSQLSSTHWIKVGEVETRYVVTRHKVRRLTEVFQEKKLSSHSPLTSDLHDSNQFRWVSLENPRVPLGAAARKTLKQIQSLSLSAEAG